MLKLVLILRCIHRYIVLIFSFTNLNPCKFMGPKRGLLFDEGIDMKKVLLDVAGNYNAIIFDLTMHSF